MENDTTVAARARAASARPNTVAASQQSSVPSLLNGLCIEPDVSMRTRVRPPRAGTLARACCKAFSSGYAHRRLGAALYAERKRIGSTREAATWLGSESLAATVSATVSLTPTWSKLRRLRNNAK